MTTLNLSILQSKLADARLEVRNLTVLAMYPDLTEKEAARKLERSARAEVKLRIEALKRANMNSN